MMDMVGMKTVYDVLTADEVIDFIARRARQVRGAAPCTNRGSGGAARGQERLAEHAPVRHRGISRLVPDHLHRDMHQGRLHQARTRQSGRITES
jgi:hypothetical protein